MVVLILQYLSFLHCPNFLLFLRGALLFSFQWEQCDSFGMTEQKFGFFCDSSGLLPTYQLCSGNIKTDDKDSKTVRPLQDQCKGKILTHSGIVGCSFWQHNFNNSSSTANASFSFFFINKAP